MYKAKTTLFERHHPALSLVGAGPGDPELITLKALKTLERADVVLYDALVNGVLLDYAPIDARKVFVGKRAGRHSFGQEAINDLIVKYAFTEGHVVRLKGGDPYIFGRGYEELLHARCYGIPGQVIPGISSIAAVPASQGIPLTHRGLSESFWVITGTTKNGTLSQDIPWAARSTATVVILMGLRKIEEIMRVFSQYGKESLGVAVIQQGTTPGERSVFGKVSTIADEVAKAELESPALIVIGKVVQEKENLKTLSALFQEEPSRLSA